MKKEELKACRCNTFSRDDGSKIYVCVNCGKEWVLDNGEMEEL